MIFESTPTGLVLGNSYTKLAITFENGYPQVKYLENRISGRRFSGNGTIPMVLIPGFSFKDAKMEVTDAYDDRGGLSERAHVINLNFTKEGQQVTLSFRTYENNPFITLSATLYGRFVRTEAKLYEDELWHSKEHTKKGKPWHADSQTLIPSDDEIIFGMSLDEYLLKLQYAELLDVTDRADNLVLEQTILPYSHRTNKLRGHIFNIDDYQTGEALLIVKEAPCRLGKLHDKDYDLNICPYAFLYLTGFGHDFNTEHTFTGETLYGASIGLAKEEEILSKWREYYRFDCKAITDKGLTFMSNNWGDHHSYSMTEQFVSKELDCGKKLGLTVCQLDDGWMKGKTANSGKSTAWSSGYYDLQDDFWAPSENVFPSGFEKIAEKAKDYGITMGLWFSPDQGNEFENYKRDVDTVIDLYQKYGIKYFKQDGMNIPTLLHSKRMAAYSEEASKRSHNEVVFDYDITDQIRWGFLPNRQYGNLFVENRYTDERVYFPFRTLRNTWMLSKYIPTAKIQMEFMNPKLHDELYRGNQFRPLLHDIDYEFATVMYANPLAWMELSALTEEDLEKLSGITNLWNKYRHELAKCDIYPIGEMPDGFAYTGFVAENEQAKYLLLFRENSKEDTYTFNVKLPEKSKMEVLYNPKGCTVELKGNQVLFTAPEERSFIWVKIS